VQSKAKVVVQASSGVLLDDEGERSCFGGGVAAAWLGCLAEVAHLAIARQLVIY
jgi:hypothetical protein